MMICVNSLLTINWLHNNFQGIHFHEFRKLLQTDAETFIQKIPEYLVKTQTMYMFVRVERPKGSRKFVLGYVKCNWVFSFAKRFEQIRLLLNRVPPTLLTKVESEENKALRLACVGDTNYERALVLHSDTLEFGDFGVLLTPLGAALKAKDEDAAEALLDGGDDPNEDDGRGMNALHRAAEKGCRLPLFHRILGMIHNVNAVNKYGNTAFKLAAYFNHLDMVVSLLNHPGINVNAKGFNDCTALHQAVSNNHLAIVAHLLSDDRVDTSLISKYTGTPLKMAINDGHDECAKILREHGARIHFHEFRKLLQTDAKTFIQKIPEYLVKTQDMYMFVRVERPKGSRRFVLGYVKCNWVFSFAKRFEQIRLLLNRVPPRVLRDVENGENKALRLACVGETDYERALTLHSDTMLPAFWGEADGCLLTPLGAAIYAEDDESAEALLDGETDPNEVDARGMNALHRAAEKSCRLPLFHRILGMIHNVNAGVNGGFTALIIAAGYNRLDMVVSLMNHPGIDVNIQGGWNNMTALNIAVHNNCPAIVAQLVSDDRVDTSLKDKTCLTPLKYAILTGLDECAKILREHGAPEE